VWKGKMGNSRVELKLVRKGDSLIGTSYYYDSKSSYRRYSVKGYFDDQKNDVIWWDDILIEEHGAHHFMGTGPQSDALLAVADFNCPGEGVMKLDGNSSRKDDKQKEKKELHLVKGSTAALFPDEWDFLIENYAYGVNHPEVVDSIEQYAFNPEPSSGQNETAQPSQSATPAANVFVAPPSANYEGGEKTVTQESLRETPSVVEKPVSEKRENSPPIMLPPSQQTNEERFIRTTKILQNVIPLKGDSIELRFYDNAEIDGDSIAVFLNGRLLKEHILLAEQAYIMKISVKDLQQDNELVMVAENLGTIPPNTSLMVAVVEDKKYEAHLESTMGSSALVRLVKP
ncbi:MAG TPA: hypothetical protein VK772_11125, partial [Puia sp.]|nr:hypothetical protein [Puia sp.]